MSGKLSFIGFENQPAFSVKEAKAFAQGRIDAFKGVEYNANKYPRDPDVQLLYAEGYDSWIMDVSAYRNPYDAAGAAYRSGGNA